MIEFSAQGVEMPEIDIEKISEWIREVSASHGYTVGNLNYLFMGDEDILVANRQFVGHDYFTDIITFDYTHGKRIGGDIMISLETVASNAEKFGVTYSRELMRVIIHGVLHLCGINDKGPGEREIMEAHEDAALNILDNAQFTIHNSQ